jgi:hypothetical protein
MEVSMSKLEKAGDIFKKMIEEKDSPSISKQKQRLVESLVDAREADRKKNQELMYNSRPFVLCALPVKRPPKGMLLHERRNGKVVLQVVGHPKYGLPFGQDRLIPIWITTLAVRQQSRRVTFRSAAEMLDMFGLPKDGKAYRRLVEGFRRVYGATIFYGTDTERQPAEPVFESSRFNFFDRIKIWRPKPGDAQQPLPQANDPDNVIEISEAFWDELQKHPIPIEAAHLRLLAASPAQLDFYIWLVWRCYTVRRLVSIPLMGAGGLMEQLGISEKTKAFEFRRQVKHWLRRIKMADIWPACPAGLSADGNYLVIDQKEAIAQRKQD